VERGQIEAPRSKAAYEVAGIDVDQLALALAERLKKPAVELPMFGELAEDWLAYITPKRVEADNEKRLVRRLLPLFLEDEESLTAAKVVELLDAQADFGPSTKNKLRGVGRMIIDWAAAAQRWNRPNPFALVKRQKEGVRKYEQLTLDELYRVQAHLRPDRLLLFRVALHLGLRPGELMALRIEDLDFPNHVVHVRRSRDRDTTKTGKEREVPMHPAVVTDLLDAATLSKSVLVFGQRFDGALESQMTKLTRVLRTAMVAAGVGIEGVDWKCRRKGCGFHEYIPGAFDKRRRRRCPSCEFALWPVPKVRPVRWYDLRHMCATFHHDAGADKLCVALALGHAVKSGTTEKIYTHPTRAKMSLELGRWKLARVSKSPSQTEQTLTSDVGTR
jgi:integrase